MIATLPKLVKKYHASGVLLDSNLLLLLFVGLVSPELVNHFKRTQNQGFTEREFIFLQNPVKSFKRVITTPHILTETSNYIGQLKGESRELALRLIADTIPAFKERRPEARHLVQTGGFMNFGLTDSAILDLPPRKYLVLSVDVLLVLALNQKGVDAINFNRLLSRLWQS